MRSKTVFLTVACSLLIAGSAVAGKIGFVDAERAVSSVKEGQEDLQNQELQARRAFEDARRKFERDVDDKQNEFLGDVAVKVGTVASDYGRDNDYDAIFVLKAQPLVYVRESADLTDIVIELYDERFPHDAD
jgi:Skp family chaperone for outer membrane proteins